MRAGACGAAGEVFLAMDEVIGMATAGRARGARRLQHKERHRLETLSLPPSLPLFLPTLHTPNSLINHHGYSPEAR